MPRKEETRLALTIGQLAKRWGVGTDRVRRLVLAGPLPGTFTIPSAGRYGATVKIPLATVIQVETTAWATAPNGSGPGPERSRRRNDSGPALRHFPKLAAATPGPASGCRGAAPG